MKAKAARVTAHIVREYRMEFAVVTAVLYAVAMVLVIFLFPDVSNLWVSVFVLMSGFTASISTLGDLMVSADDDKAPKAEGAKPRPPSADPLTPAGLLVRERFATLDEERDPNDPVRQAPFTVCAREHVPGQICIREDGHG